MKKLSTLLVVLYCTVWSTQEADAVLRRQCKNLVPQNVTLEDFAGSWILVEAYFEFPTYPRRGNESEERKLKQSLCETLNVNLAEPNLFINETHLRGYTISKSEEYAYFAKRNVSFIMPQTGVFQAVSVSHSYRGFPLIFIGMQENKDYMTVATCEDQDWFASNVSFQLTTLRSSNSDYNKTVVQEMREKIKTTLDLENITPLPYRQDCT